jgi:hypothetical protein
MDQHLKLSKISIQATFLFFVSLIEPLSIIISIIKSLIFSIIKDDVCHR